MQNGGKFYLPIFRNVVSLERSFERGVDFEFLVQSDDNSVFSVGAIRFKEADLKSIDSRVTLFTSVSAPDWMSMSIILCAIIGRKTSVLGSETLRT